MRRHWRLAVLVAALWLLCAGLAGAADLHGRVTWINDGDTLQVAGIGAVRLEYLALDDAVPVRGEPVIGQQEAAPFMAAPAVRLVFPVGSSRFALQRQPAQRLAAVDA